MAAVSPRVCPGLAACPSRRPRAGPLVAWTTSRLKVSAHRHSVHKFTFDTQTSKSDWPRLDTPYLEPPGAQAWAAGVWCPVMNVASKELVGCWLGLPCQGDSRWAGVLEGHRGRGGHTGLRRRSRNSGQVPHQCLPVFGRQLQASGAAQL